MQLENVFEQLVRIFNSFYALNSTTDFLFELADSFSRSNWQMSNWQWIGRQLQLGDISTAKLPKCSSILFSILASLSRICRRDTFPSLNSISSLLSLFGDGWDCEEELAALALRLDIKMGFTGVYFTEQKACVRPPLRRWLMLWLYRSYTFTLLYISIPFCAHWVYG